MMGSWDEVRISEVYKALYDGPHATPNLCDEGPIFLSIANLSESGELDLASTKHISEAEFPRWTKRVTPKHGDIVFTYEASLHRYAVIPKGFHGCLGRRLALVRPDNSKAHYKYLFYYFLSDAWKKEVSNYILTGTTVDRVPLTKFPRFKLRLPDVRTQKKIAAILSAYDDLIENNKRRIALLEKMAEEIYREWFVRFRFPGYQTAEFEKGIPKGWDIKPFSELVYINPTERPHKDDEKPYVGMDALSTNLMYFKSEERRQDNAGSKFRNGDTLFPRITPCLENGKRGFVMTLDHNEVGIGSTEFIVFRQKVLTPEYIYLLSIFEPFRTHAEISMVGASGRQRVAENCFSFFLIRTPPKTVLDKFTKVVRPLFEQIKTLSEANQTLVRTRDQLFPRLISGKLSVTALDIQFPPSMSEDEAA